MDKRVHFPFPDSDLSYTEAGTGFTIWNRTDSIKVGMHGNFVDPTPYYFARSRLFGAVCAEAKVDQEYYTTYGGPGWRPGGYAYSKWEYPLTWGSISSPSQEGLALLADLKSAATRELLNAVSGELTDFDLLTEIAEFEKTATFWKSSVRALSEFVFYVWRRKPLRALQALGIKTPRKRDQRWTMRRINHWASQKGSVEDACGDIWLKYRYAFLPTMYAGNDALKALAGFSDDVIPTRSQASFPGRKYYLDSGSTTWHEVNGNAFQYATKRENVWEASVRASGFWKGLKGLADAVRGTRLVDYAQTLWEVAPFSFVVDWFWDLSTYLDGCRTTSKVTWERGMFSYKMVWTEALTGYFMLPQDTQTTRWSGGFKGTPRTSAHRKTFYFAREPWESNPLEFVQLPSFDPAFNWRRMLDMGAFTLAAMKGRLKHRWSVQLTT